MYNIYILYLAKVIRKGFLKRARIVSLHRLWLWLTFILFGWLLVELTDLRTHRRIPVLLVLDALLHFWAIRSFIECLFSGSLDLFTW